MPNGNKNGNDDKHDDETFYTGQVTFGSAMLTIVFILAIVLTLMYIFGTFGPPQGAILIEEELQIPPML